MMTAEELLRWCAENDVVPKYYSNEDLMDQEGCIQSAGCGCCSDPIRVNNAVREALQIYLKKDEND